MFFFNETATTEIYTLSLHDALPIYGIGVRRAMDDVGYRPDLDDAAGVHHGDAVAGLGDDAHVVRDQHHRGAVLPARSEEHTSELQSQSNLVCRLLLEKKKKRQLETQ